MSRSLHWKPVPKPIEDNYLSHDLLYTLEKRYGYVGSSEIRMSAGAIPYLEGLADAGVEDAQTLIDLILEHGEVDLYLEH